MLTEWTMDERRRAREHCRRSCLCRENISTSFAGNECDGANTQIFVHNNLSKHAVIQSFQCVTKHRERERELIAKHVVISNCGFEFLCDISLMSLWLAVATSQHNSTKLHRVIGGRRIPSSLRTVIELHQHPQPTDSITSCMKTNALVATCHRLTEKRLKTHTEWNVKIETANKKKYIVEKFDL